MSCHCSCLFSKALDDKLHERPAELHVGWCAACWGVAAGHAALASDTAGQVWLPSAQYLSLLHHPFMMFPEVHHP